MAQKIEIIIDGNNIKAVNAISGTETQLKKLDSQSKKSGSIMDSVFGSLGNKIAFGAAAGITAIGLMIKNTIDLADNLNDLSKKTGVSVEQLSTMKYAAETSGSSLEGMSTSILKLNKNIYEAINGGGEAGEAFVRLGIKVKDSAGNITSADQVMYQIADRFKNMPDGVDKTALAMKLFGKSGSEMIPMLNDGSAALMKMQDEARKLGLEISTKTAQQMDEFNDKMARVEGSVKGLVISLVTNLGPAVTSILSNFAEGLDVVFGKVELIDGIQFRSPVMGLAMMNEQNRLLIGTSKEYREELIKSIQAQIAVNMGNQLEAEYKLQTLNTQLGILTLLTDEDNIQAEKVRTAKAQVAALTQQLNIIKQFGSNKPTTIVDPKQIADAEKLNKEWQGIAASLRYENMVAGLDPQSKKLDELIHKANQLKEKYYAIPGAIELINYNLETMISEQFKVTDLKFDINIPKKIKPDLEPLNPLDDKAATESGNRIKNTIQEISLASQLDFEIMQGYGSEAFGMMGDAANAFYELSGNKSKELFALNKAFSIGQAIMNTYEGASKAIAQGGIFGGIMAAAVIAMGMAQVAKIASTQPGSSGGSGGSMSGGSISRSTAMANTSGMINNTTNNNNVTSTPSITFIVNGDVLDADKWFRNNSAALNKAIKDGVINFGNN